MTCFQANWMQALLLLRKPTYSDSGFKAKPAKLLEQKLESAQLPELWARMELSAATDMGSNLGTSCDGKQQMKGYFGRRECRRTGEYILSTFKVALHISIIMKPT